MKRPLDPHKTILILKHDGKEVGRVAATAPNANEYMEELGRHYKEITVDEIEDADAAMISRMFR